MIRLISGRYARKKLHLPPETTTRPTSGKVREALFNILTHDDELTGCIDQAIVLDAFAGSGALGLEALSRGAEKAYFMENHRKAYEILSRNINHVIGDTPIGKAYLMDALNPSQTSHPCSLIFIDPPYQKNIIEKALLKLNKACWIAQNAIIVVECSSTASLNFPREFKEKIRKRYGQTALIIGKWDKRLP